MSRTVSAPGYSAVRTAVPAGYGYGRWQQIEHRLPELAGVSPQAYEKIVILAGVLPRTTVVDRARAAVAHRPGQ